MTSFTAVALDRLLDPEASKLAASATALAAEAVESRPGVPRGKIGRRNSMPAAAASAAAVAVAVESERRAAPQWPHISPALYVTPEARPLPDSPVSGSQSAFPPSPYVINHKRRGPRLMKSFSEQNVGAKGVKDAKLGETENSAVGNGVPLNDTDTEVVCNGHVSNAVVGSESSMVNGVTGRDDVEKVAVNSVHGGENGVLGGENGDEGEKSGVMGGNVEMNAVGGMSFEGEGEMEDFFDPQDSLSYMSGTDVEDSNAELSGRMGTPGGEFFDAWEELSFDSGRYSHRSIHDADAELREMKLSFLMEVEKRKQAEDALNNMRNQWQILKEKMKSVGLVLPPGSFPEDAKPDIESADEICRQFYVSCVMSECMGMEVAKAEAEAVLEAHLETKNFEIARLNDRLHYYESMNREMSQRNQEAIERARHDRQKRKRRFRWVWGSVGIAIAVGGVALALSYGPSGKSSSSSSIDHLQAAEPEVTTDS